MSNKQMKDTNKASKPATKPVNPYARKNSAAPKQTGSNGQTAANTKNPRASGGALKPVDIGASASFSQAFASVEDTSHFQSEQASMRQQKGGKNKKAANTLDESWAAQRAFDENAAVAEQSGPLLSDRDHHALMQPHVLYVSTKQKGNGILKLIRNVPFEFSRMVPDYVMNTSRCALFLSCKYHSLYPDYIHRRIAELKTDFTLRVLLVLVDVEDNANTLNFLNKLAVVNNMTLILAWSEEEAARYLETYKAFDGKDASSIQRREQSNFVDQVSDFLCTARGVNKTDSASLLSQFGSLKAISAASVDELGILDGMGEVKVKRLHEALHKPFSSLRAKRRKEEAKDASDADEASDKKPPAAKEINRALEEIIEQDTTQEAEFDG